MLKNKHIKYVQNLLDKIIMHYNMLKNKQKKCV